MCRCELASDAAHEHTLLSTFGCHPLAHECAMLALRPGPGGPLQPCHPCRGAAAARMPEILATLPLHPTRSDAARFRTIAWRGADHVVTNRACKERMALFEPELLDRSESEERGPVRDGGENTSVTERKAWALGAYTVLY